MPLPHPGHVLLTARNGLYHAICQRCGLRVSAPNERDVLAIMESPQSHPCTKDRRLVGNKTNAFGWEMGIRDHPFHNPK